MALNPDRELPTDYIENTNPKNDDLIPIINFQNNESLEVVTISNLKKLIYSEQTYEVNDIMELNGLLFQCTTQITAGEPYDFSKWKLLNGGREYTSILFSTNPQKVLVEETDTQFSMAAAVYAFLELDGTNHKDMRVKFITLSDSGPILDSFLADPVTFILVDITGAIIQQNIAPILSQLRDHVFIGINLHSASLIFESVPSPVGWFGSNSTNIQTLFLGLGRRLMGGSILPATTADLRIQKEVSTLLAGGKEFPNNPLNPNVIIGVAANPIPSLNLFKLFENASGDIVFDTTNAGFLRPSQFNDNGVLTTISPANNWTNQFVVEFAEWIFVGAAIVKRVNVSVYYGDTKYSTKSDALLGQDAEAQRVVKPAQNVGGVFTNILTMQSSITNLVDAALPANELFIVKLIGMT